MLALLTALADIVGRDSVSAVNKGADREAFYAARALLARIEGKETP